MVYSGRRVRRGFSLLEMIMASTVMSIVAVVIVPVIMASTDSYVSSRDTRASTDRVLYALERVARLVREAPFAADESGLDVLSATDAQLIFVDGSGVRISGDRLELLGPGGNASVLCTGIDKMDLSYFDSSGGSMGTADPRSIHRVSLWIQSGQITLEMYAMPRAWIGR